MKRNRFDEGRFGNQVFATTMKTCFMYACDIVIRDQTNIILVRSNNMMQYILGGYTECKNDQQNAGKKTSYDVVSIQLPFATRLQINAFLLPMPGF